MTEKRVKEKESKLKANFPIPVSICVPAYNEEQNIGNLLMTLLSQQTKDVEIMEIIVVASGCTDNTVKNVKKIQSNKKIKLIIQKERNGKSAAINEFLKTAKENICVIIGADTLPNSNTVENLCSVFKDKTIGMAGGHPTPTNNPKSFIGFCVNTLWQLHHELALKTPKCGEIIAFRKLFKQIPPNSAVDEASIENEIAKQNLQLIYVENAIIKNKGPETIKEFIAQRRRINCGHIWLKKNFKYKVSTTNYWQIIKLAKRKLSPNIKKNIYLLCLILLEITSKILAYSDYYFFKKTYTVWPQIKSSKNL